MNIDTPIIHQLRSLLLDQGTRSLFPEPGTTRFEEESLEERAVVARFRPFAEIFYLVAAADGAVDAEEERLIRGAYQVLTAGRVRREILDELQVELRNKRERFGTLNRLEIVCTALASEREDAELAFTLASAVALADKRIDEAEQTIVESLAGWLGLSEKRATAILDTRRSSWLPPPPPEAIVP